MRTSLWIFTLAAAMPLTACAKTSVDDGAANSTASSSANAPPSGTAAPSAATTSSVAATPETSALIENVPHVRQKQDFCGEACAEMFLRKLGHDINQDDVFNLSGVDPVQARGCVTVDLARTLRIIGFDVGAVWYRVTPGKAAAELETQWRAVLANLQKGIPSIVCTHYDDQPQTTEHFRLVLGYDAKTQEVIYHEPAVDNAPYRRMKKAKFLDLWPLKYKRDQWTVIRFTLAPGKIKKIEREPGFSNANYVQHIMALEQRIIALKNKKKLTQNFNILIERPFLVIGDETPEQLKEHASGTIKWATTKLKKDYFPKDPKAITDVWLFKNKASYNKHTKAIFDDTPSTPYGYFSEEHQALIMNIATGGGTLIHEMVHAFMKPNFPGCPAWFNEGLGSLYEQSGGRGDQIVGLTNWRLAGLQQALRAGSAPSFETLLGTSDYEFYQEDPGTNYAQARYLLYYLQEQGQLREFYREFRANHKKDPSGLATLKRILKTDDLKAFQKKWAPWVLKLRYR